MVKKRKKRASVGIRQGGNQL